MLYYKLVFNRTHVIHLSSKLIFDIERLIPVNKVHIVNNGVEDYKVSIKDDQKVKINFLYLSNFVPEKGAHTLIDSLKYIPSEYHDMFNLTLAGKFTDQEYKNIILKKIDNNSSIEINLHEGLYEDDKKNALNKCDVFVLPTYFKNECFPLSILEAMSANSAIISTNEGAISDFVIHDTNGFIVEQENAFELSKAIIKLINLMIC